MSSPQVGRPRAPRRKDHGDEAAADPCLHCLSLLLGRDLRTATLGPEKSPHPPAAMWNQPLLQWSLSLRKFPESPACLGPWQLAQGRVEWLRNGAGFQGNEILGISHPPQRKEQIMQILGSKPLATYSVPLLSLSLGFWEGEGLSRKRPRLSSSHFLITGETGAQSW